MEAATAAGWLFGMLTVPVPSLICFVAAGYAVYGPTTLLVLTVGTGVHCFTLDREMGSWVLTQSNMTIPEDTKDPNLIRAKKALKKKMPKLRPNWKACRKM